MNSSTELFEKLKSIIDLPDDVIELDLHLSVNEIPTMKLKVYSKSDNISMFPQIETNKYKLVLIE